MGGCGVKKVRAVASTKGGRSQGVAMLSVQLSAESATRVPEVVEARRQLVAPEGAVR